MSLFYSLFLYIKNKFNKKTRLNHLFYFIDRIGTIVFNIYIKLLYCNILMKIN